MKLLRRLFAKQEISDLPYSAEVLCSNWVAPPAERDTAPLHSVTLERLREADAVTILARIYATQRC